MSTILTTDIDKNERHVFIVAGISREAFTEHGVRQTTADPGLLYYVHGHRHDPYGAVPCNCECIIVRAGKVEPITLSDDANARQVG